MDKTVYLLNISRGQVQTKRNNAALQIAARYNAVAALQSNHASTSTANNNLSPVERDHTVMAAAFAGALSGPLAALLAQAVLAYAAACLAVCLTVCAGAQLANLGRSVAVK